jgi:hypothetical protein
MSYGLVRILALGAGALITAGAVERGYRHGREKGQTKLAGFDANAVMRSTYTTNDDFILDGLSDGLRNQTTFNTGIMASIARGWHGAKGAVTEIAKSIVPLGIAGVAFAAGGPIGWIGLGVLGLWGGKKVLENSGIVRNGNANPSLDIKV